MLSFMVEFIHFLKYVFGLSFYVIKPSEYIFFLSSPGDTFIDFLERGRERDRHSEKEREALI